MWRANKAKTKAIAAVILIAAMFLTGFPSAGLFDSLKEIMADRNVVDSLYLALKDPNVIDKGMASLFNQRVKEAGAATFQMQTGYYMGNGGVKQITGLGFSPQMIIVKANTNAGAGAIFKTTVMPALNTAYLGPATTDTATGVLTLNEDGFTAISSTANTVNVRHTWVAFSGSDCSASGNFCIGTYTGNGSSPRAISTGFQPDLVMVKPVAATAANWRSSSMPTNYANFFINTAQDTTGAFYTTLDSAGFTVGASNNSSGIVYYFVAFKNTSNAIKVGSYTGTGSATNVTGVGFQPDFVFTKNATNATAQQGVFNLNESYGNSSSYFYDAANVVNTITGLNSDGFGVGTSAIANGNTNTHYYAAFKGAPPPSSSGTFKIARGSYTGTGVNTSIENLGFVPDLVIIKGNTGQAGVFRTRMMNGDYSTYLDAATASLTGAITALNPDGFTVGTSATVNSSGVTYYWTAYGNAWNPETNSGSSDFYIGAYYGNGIDNRDITRLPFQANMVAVKTVGSTYAGVWRSSEHSGDLSSFFAAGTADSANYIQSLGPNGFQVGTGSRNVNYAAYVYYYFGFKSGSNFSVGTYSGTGSAQDITGVGFQPDYLWVKHTGTTQGVSRNSSLSGDGALPFVNASSVANALSGFVSDGFSVGTAAETNSSGTNNYRYVAWRLPDTNTITLSSTGSQLSTIDIPNTNKYIGGAFTFVRNAGSANVTAITITETGTVDANADLSNAEIYYETAGTCTFDGNETQFGSSQSFSSSEATFSGAMAVSTSQVCVYVVLDIGSGASDGETLDIEIGSGDVTVSSGNLSASYPVQLSGSSTLQAGGTLSVDIVDGNGSPVASPTMGMATTSFSFVYQNSSGTFGTSTQKVRVSNLASNPQWSLSLAANDGPTAFWDGATTDYDFNDPTANAQDGADSDSLGGRLTLDPSQASVSPQSGCSTDGISLGSLSGFAEGTVDSLTLVSSGSESDLDCYWDIVGISVSQTIPAEQATDSYSLDMTLTITAI